MITTLPGVQYAKPGSAGTPLPGVFADVVGESDGQPLAEGQGLLVLTRPWPAMLRTLYKEPERFVETYFSRLRPRDVPRRRRGAARQGRLHLGDRSHR